MILTAAKHLELLRESIPALCTQLGPSPGNQITDLNNKLLNYQVKINDCMEELQCEKCEFNE